MRVEIKPEIIEDCIHDELNFLQESNETRVPKDDILRRFFWGEKTYSVEDFRVGLLPTTTDHDVAQYSLAEVRRFTEVGRKILGIDWIRLGLAKPKEELRIKLTKPAQTPRDTFWRRDCKTINYVVGKGHADSCDFIYGPEGNKYEHVKIPAEEVVGFLGAIRIASEFPVAEPHRPIDFEGV